MTKITAEHLARGAFVYVRQSTAFITIMRSRRRQYGLADRARALGWGVVVEALGKRQLSNGELVPDRARLLLADLRVE
jgi:hypothetical protein